MKTIKMQSKIKWHYGKVVHYQQVELAHAKLGESKQAEIAKQTIEHYQELLNSQR